jgi:NAD(P)-dependent dehydrogenase (short-subunit alcohol dehydrogenase family)
MKDFKDKVAVVTGAASGIGYGLAERCAQEGMKVVLAGINEDTLQKAEAKIKRTGAATLVVKTDVSKAADVKALVEKTLNAFGAVHLLFNNAGVEILTTVRESTLADWEWMLGVNLWGVIHGIHFFLPVMIEQGVECHIVNTSSVAGLASNAQGGVYSVVKHGVVALSETLYLEMVNGGYNIGVSVLCPGSVKSNVLESERNRPVSLKNKPGEGMDVSDARYRTTIQILKQMNENGMPPQEVADIVFRAIGDKKFYILPNTGAFVPAIRARRDDILQERNPSAVFIDLK